MRTLKFLYSCHLVALLCGFVGLVVLAPFPRLWASNPLGKSIFQFLLDSSATLLILFGAATMLLFGLLFMGARKTITFFASATLITLSMELFGADIGFPFSTSASTTYPGIKVAGFLSYAVLLSWFYMGFASYLLAYKLASRLGLRRQTLWSLSLGAYFLIAWELALNSAMANIQPAPQALIWHEYGSYFGMPVRTLVGWTVNGLIFLCVSRLLWREGLDAQSRVNRATWLPFGVYTANTGLVMLLNIDVGLWFISLLSALFVLLPESLVLFPPTEKRDARTRPVRTMLSQAVWLVIRVGSWVIARRSLNPDAEGLENLPRGGPLLIAARHFHYFYDGHILVSTIPRRLHTIVALDWMRSHPLRFLIEFCCALADWPVILRSEQFSEHREDVQWAYTPAEARQYLRQVMLASSRLLRSGEVLVIFPEGYPNIDPHPTPKADLDAFLPFRPGFLKMAELAERDGHTKVAIVPAGLSYSQPQGKRWRAIVRYGPPLFLGNFASAEELLHAVEEQVQTLSSSR